MRRKYRNCGPRQLEGIWRILWERSSTSHIKVCLLNVLYYMVGTSAYIHAHTHARVPVYDHARVYTQNTEQESCWRHLQWVQLLIAYCIHRVVWFSHPSWPAKGRRVCSPSNASVLPNGLETKVRTGGGPVVERCSLSLVLEAERKNQFTEHLLRAGQPGLLPGRLTTCLLKQWCGRVTLTGLVHSFSIQVLPYAVTWVKQAPDEGHG